MSKDRTMLLRFKLRRGTAASLYAHNEIPLRGEPVIEMDSKLFKVGNGINSYNDLEYSNRLPHVAAAAPLTTDTDYPIGTLWINTAAMPAKVHILVAKSAIATWRQFVHPEDLASLGMGDMLKLTYDTNDDGKVNAADEADKLANAVTIGIIGDATGSATGDLSANQNIDLHPRRRRDPVTRGVTGLSKIRGGARAALDASGLVPERREIIAYTDILRFKVGDGITTVALLPYAGIGQPSPYIPGNLVTFDPSTDSLIDTGVSITDVTTYA